LSGDYISNWLYDYARELRQQRQPGLYLGTAYSAQGRELRHVVLLDGGWHTNADHVADARRLYYVGMTRAEDTLTLCEFAPGNPLAAPLTDSTPAQSFTGQPLAALNTRYYRLALSDINLGYTARKPPDDPIHTAIATLHVGDPLQLKQDDYGYQLRDRHGQPVGRTARKFRPAFAPQQCRVAAILTRFADDGEPEYRSGLKCERWQYVVPRLEG